MIGGERLSLIDGMSVVRTSHRSKFVFLRNLLKCSVLLLEMAACSYFLTFLYRLYLFVWWSHILFSERVISIEAKFGGKVATVNPHICRVL